MRSIDSERSIGHALSFLDSDYSVRIAEKCVLVKIEIVLKKSLMQTCSWILGQDVKIFDIFLHVGGGGRGGRGDGDTNPTKFSSSSRNSIVSEKQ